MTFSPSEIFAYWAAVRPANVALVCDQERICWSDFNHRARSVAAAIQSCGIQPGDRVALLLPSSADWAIIYGAIWIAGGVVVPLNHRFGAFELREIEADADCSLLITTALHGGPLAERFALGASAGDDIVLACRKDRSEAAKSYAIMSDAGLEPQPGEFDPAALAAIFYTSGTTGQPKGTMHSHASIQAGVNSHAVGWGMTSADVTLTLAPLAFTGVSLCLLTPLLLMGGCTVIEREFDPARMLHILERERVSFLSGVPVIWDRLPALPGFNDADLSGLRNPQTGGAPVPRSLLEVYSRRGIVIRQSYGTTEAGGFVTFPTAEQALADPDSAGTPVLGLQVRIVDGNRQPCAEGVVGEIEVKGPQVMSGYWRNPSATSTALVDGWYRTGDLGRRDAKAGLRILDRLKNMIISGGVNIYPAEIERAMASIEGVLEIGVFGMPDERWGEKAVAMIHGCSPSEADRIRDEARILLGPIKAPRQIVICRDPLPRTVTGKIARHHLPQLLLDLDATPVGDGDVSAH